ncbi:MAG TPA: ABC transporter permease [Gemmatimonadota bacterium]|nr:ABC transporter permease [Gemmatimonadota bacterium]
MNGRRLKAIARKEAIQLRRDTRSLILAFLIPPFMILFFGYAITFDVDDVALAVWDGDRTTESARLVEAFTASGYFTVAERVASHDDVEDPVVYGRARATLAIPPGFARDLAAGRPAPVQLLLDGADANTATIALGYARAIVAAWSAEAVLEGREVRPPIQASARVWYNPSLESRNMVVPGLIAVILSILAAMLTALTIAREWERGTMEQLVSTPVTRAEIIVGKLLPYLAIGIFDVLLAVAIGRVLFGVPFRGSLLLLVIVTVFFLLAALGFGMFLSAFLKSQVLATQVAMVATYLPALLLSGFIFAISSMPPFLQGLTYLFPARYYVTTTQAVFLKGVGAAVLWQETLALAALALLATSLTVVVFRKRIA